MDKNKNTVFVFDRILPKLERALVILLLLLKISVLVLQIVHH